MIYLLYAFYWKYHDAICEMSSLLAPVRCHNLGVFFCGIQIIVSDKFWAAFPDYSARKSLCCHLIVNCDGVPDYGAGNTLYVNFLIALPWTIGWSENSGRLRRKWRLGTAWTLALGVRVGPFCNYRM